MTGLAQMLGCYPNRGRPRTVGVYGCGHPKTPENTIGLVQGRCRICKRAASEAYRKSNPGYFARYREAHREAHKGYMKNYHASKKAAK